MGSKDNSLSDSDVGKWVPQLVPFLLSAAAYMTHFDELGQSVFQTLYSPDVAEPTLWVAFLKCCPVLCLIMFVVSYEGSGNNVLQDSNNCDLRPAQDPLHHFCDPGFLNSSNIGFGMSFARALRAEVPEEDLIVLVPSAIGGTGFKDGTWTANEGPGFKEAVRRTTYTLSLVQAWCQVCTVNFAGMLWHQGENDDTETADTYLYKDLIPLIEAMRNDSVIPGSSPQVPFIVGNLVPDYLAANPVRFGVLSAVQLLPHYVQRTATAPSFGLLPDKQDPLYPVHFNAASQRLLGKRYYAAYKLRYKAFMAAALALGCIGDGCLVFPSTFVCGMLSFAAGHALYIHAYGLQPLKAGLGFFLFAVCSCLLLYVRQMVEDEFIKGAMPFYSVFLVAMAWRGLARMNENVWSKVRGLGGVLFLISDFLLVLQFGIHIPYGEMLVLGTYYASQMCAALSILDPSSEIKRD